jgi:hypothetical protein
MNKKKNLPPLDFDMASEAYKSANVDVTVPEPQNEFQDEWQRFLELAKEYKDSDKPSIQVWLDADVKCTLEALRQSGVKIPVKHLVSAAVHAFLDNNKKEVKKMLKTQPKVLKL